MPDLAWRVSHRIAVAADPIVNRVVALQDRREGALIANQHHCGKLAAWQFARCHRVGADTGPVEVWSLLYVYRVHEPFELLEVRPFVACKPLRIKQHSSFEHLSRPRNRRHA